MIGIEPSTHQQRQYEASYVEADSEYGFPDRKIVEGFDPRGWRILTVGSGTANDVWYLAQANTVVGLDYAASGLRVARRHGVLGVRGDLNRSFRLPFADQAFDVVVCKDILEHVMEPLAVLGEVRRVLKDAGYVVISVPNHFYLPMRLLMLAGQGIISRGIGTDHSSEYDEWNYMHIRFFTFRGFRRFLTTAGLRAEKWFWDFGTLAHYCNPDMWFEPQLWKRSNGRPLSRRAAWALAILRPLWRVFDTVLPPKVRATVVRLAPGLLCAGFYLRARKQ